MRKPENYGCVMTFNGVDYAVIGPPREQLKTMARDNYIESQPTEFSMLRDDYVASKVALRNTVIADGRKFEVISILDDPVDPSVDLKCTLKQ